MISYIKGTLEEAAIDSIIIVFLDLLRLFPL